MDWVADQAFATLTQTRRLTMIVQDNDSLHTSQLTQQQWQRWQVMGLFLFFLPQCASEMNRIEDEWHQLKTHEIAGRRFEHEYDLAIALCAVPFGQSLLWMAWKPEVLKVDTHWSVLSLIPASYLSLLVYSENKAAGADGRGQKE